MFMSFDKITNIPDLSRELEFSASRSSGPGGQNVNKVNTRIELRFHVRNSQLLTDEQKGRLTDKLASRLTIEGELIIVCQEKRSQLANKELATQRFYVLLEKSLRPSKKRKATKPTKASVEKRITTKKQQAEKKRLRGNIDL